MITTVSVAALMLAACSTSSPLPGSKAPPPLVSSSSQQAAPAGEPQPNAGAIAPVEAKGLERLDNMAAASGLPQTTISASTFGNSSVEVFGLDGSDMSTPYSRDRLAAARPNDGSLPTSTDSSVMIYPVDGGQYPGAGGGTWPNSLLPTSNSLTPFGRGVASLDDRGRAGTGQAGASAPRVGSGYTPSQIYFRHGSSHLGGGDRQVLRQVADQAKFAPVDRVSVEGHASTRTGVADPVEAKIVNLKQSMNRAFNVSSQLIREGVPAEKIKTTVWGDTRNEGASEAQSRRVDIVTGAQ